jgi:hypothetical protein
MKDVHDEIDVIDQRPPAAFQTFDVVGANAVLAQLIHHMLRDGAHVRIRRSARNDEEIRGARDLSEIEDDDVGCFSIERQHRGALGELG